MEYVYDHDPVRSRFRGENGMSAAVGETCEGDANFPRGFSGLTEILRPRRLYWLGASRLLTGEIVMVCGARNASEEGCGLAYRCGRMIADAGYVVSSGYARGIDLAAHRGALEAGGDTLAFLPYGIAGFKVRREIGDSFDPERFLAVSELEPWQVFSANAALRRNKLLAAISVAVIVVEPGESGGTWYSAEKAYEMGKPLFFLEGSRPEIIPAMEALGGIQLKIRNGVPDLGSLFRTLDERGSCSSFP